MHLYKIINTYHKHYIDKPTITFPSINFALVMANLIVKSVTNIAKKKQGQLAKNLIKQIKKV